MTKKFWADVAAFLLFVAGVGGFVFAVGNHYLNDGPAVAVPNETLPACESEYGEDNCVYTQDDTSWLVLDDDTAIELTSVPTGATVYEDGSWVLGDESGCIPGGMCED